MVPTHRASTSAGIPVYHCTRHGHSSYTLDKKQCILEEAICTTKATWHGLSTRRLMALAIFSCHTNTHHEVWFSATLDRAKEWAGALPALWHVAPKASVPHNDLDLSTSEVTATSHTTRRVDPVTTQAPRVTAQRLSSQALLQIIISRCDFETHPIEAPWKGSRATYDNYIPKQLCRAEDTDMNSTMKI